MVIISRKVLSVGRHFVPNLIVTVGIVCVIAGEIVSFSCI